MVLVHRYKRNNRGIIINKIQYCIKECDVYIVLERYEIRIWKKKVRKCSIKAQGSAGLTNELTTL